MTCKALAARLINFSTGCLLATTFIATVCFAQGHVIQYSSGQCSINIANVSGNVTVEGGCMDQKVISLFLDTINRQQKDYQEKATEVELWIKRYDELSMRLGTSGAFSQLREEVKKRFQEGDLEGAGRAKDQIIAGEEGLVDQLAEDYYERAEMLVLQLKPLEAQKFYAKAFQYRPTSTTYAEAYARNLCDTNQSDKAQTVYQVSANELRSLTKLEPEKYAASLSCTLVDIAGLYYLNGAYDQARIAAEEALRVAQQISPQDGREAQEHIADALTSSGIIAVKQGRIDDGQAKLLQAEEIYSKISITNSNRPILYEALADISKGKKNKEDEERELSRAVMYEEELTRTKPMDHRSRLALRLHLLFDFYKREADLEGARSTQTQFAAFVASVLTDDQGTKAFLSGTSLELRCELLLAEGNAEEARRQCLSAIQVLESIRGSLRAKESTVLSQAYDKLGWLNMISAEYRSAFEAFDNAIKADLAEGPQTRRAAADQRIAQFFVADFVTAAHDLLSHADQMSDYDKAMWDLLIRKRRDLTARMEISSQGKNEVENVLVNVASSHSPLSLLTTAAGRISHLPDIAEKCRLAFYVGEIFALAHERSRSLDIFSLCSEAKEGSPPYAWIILAERAYWSKHD
jgi:tetratricopeptide (TPR) repeat protein